MVRHSTHDPDDSNNTKSSGRSRPFDIRDCSSSSRTGPRM
jgi:hypothetical protein